MQAINPPGFGPLEAILLYVFSVFGAPQGIPPTREDPLLLAVAPEKCLYYSTWSGMANPDPNSGNSTEKLLAEPEIRKFASELVDALRKRAESLEATGGPKKADVDAMAEWITTLMTKPGAMYIADASQKNGQADVQLGIVLAAAEAAGKLDDDVLNSLKSAGVPTEDVMISGKAMHRVKFAGSDLPFSGVLTFGVVNKYWMLTLGDTEFDELRKRASAGRAPAWLEKLQQRLPIDRVSSMTYVNFKQFFSGTLPKFLGPFQGQLDSALQAAGLDGLTTLEMATGLSQTNFVSKTYVGIEGTPRGLLTYFDARPLTTEDLAGIPEGAPLASVVAFDGAKLYDAILASIRQAQPNGAPQLDEMLHAMDKTLGFSLRKDLLESLGDRASVFIPPGGNPMFHYAIAVDVKDRKRLAAVNQLLVVELQKALQGPPRVPRALPPGAPGAPGIPPGGAPGIPPMGPPGAPPGLPPGLGGPGGGLGIKLKESNIDGGRMFELELPPLIPVPITPAWAIGEKRMVFATTREAVQLGLAGSGDKPSLAANSQVAALLRGGKAISVAYQDSKSLFRNSYDQIELQLKAAVGGQPLPLTLPTAEVIEKHLLPSLTVGYRVPEGVIYESRQTMPGPNVGTLLPVAVAVMLPAVGAAREAAQRAQAMNNLKQIALGLLNHHDAQRSFPASFTNDKAGKPGLSWRVHILPYLGEDALYKQFKLDEAWDSDANKALIAKMPKVYAAPGGKAGEGKTNYLGVRGANGVFRPGGQPGLVMANITDGTSNTLAVVEVSDAAAVPWTKPDDWDFDEKDPLKGLIGLRKNGFLAAFCDGSVQFISGNVAPDLVKRLVTYNDGQPINRADIPGGK
jgi:hypothetical protein